MDDAEKPVVVGVVVRNRRSTSTYRRWRRGHKTATATRTAIKMVVSLLACATVIRRPRAVSSFLMDGGRRSLSCPIFERGMWVRARQRSLWKNGALGLQLRVASSTNETENLQPTPTPTPSSSSSRRKKKFRIDPNWREQLNADNMESAFDEMTRLGNKEEDETHADGNAPTPTTPPQVDASTGKDRRPRKKKVKINTNWREDLDLDNLEAAFEEMARKDGFEDSTAIFADDDDDDEEIDMFLDDDDDDFDRPRSPSLKEPSMAERIAQARRNIVPVPDDLLSSSKSRELGFDGEEERRKKRQKQSKLNKKWVLVTDPRTCSACGAAFQKRQEKRPGYLPPAIFDRQEAMAKYREVAEFQEKVFSEERYWTPEDEVEWLMQTTVTSSDEGEEGSNIKKPNPAKEQVDLPALARDLGLLDDTDFENGDDIDVDAVLLEKTKKTVVCQRCHGLQNSGTVQRSLRPGHTDEPTLSQEAFRNLLRPLASKQCVVVALVDLFDFGGSILPELDGIVGPSNPVLVAANKVDLLPKSMGPARVENWVRRELDQLGIQCLLSHNVGGLVRLVSAASGYGVGGLLRKAQDLAARMDDCEGIYLVGAANAGKSTLLNRLLDMHDEDEADSHEDNVSKKLSNSAKKNNKKIKKKRDGRRTVTTSPLPGTTLQFLKVDLGTDDGLHLYDTPGLLVPGTLTQLLTPRELKMVVPKKQVEPVTFRVASGKCVLVGGLARIEVIGDTRPFLFTFYVANEIKLHPTDSSKADSFVAQHLGGLLTPPLATEEDPDGDEALRMKRWKAPIYERDEEEDDESSSFWVSHELTIEGAGWKEVAADIAFRGLGWIAVTGAGVAKIRVSVPRGIGVEVRPPLMPRGDDVWNSAARYTGGKAVRGGKGGRRGGVGRR